jgi:hypothetical protein
VKHSNDVFFFTLIDFLLQVFFFGVLLFAISKALEVKRETARGIEIEQIQKLKKSAGVSNLSELVDYLARLAPLMNLQGTAEFIRKAGGIENVKAATQLVAEAGGVKELKSKIEKYEAQYGLPSCIGNELVSGKAVPKAVATLNVSDDTISVVSASPEFDRLVAELGGSVGARSYDLATFKARFQPLKTIHPRCVHFVDVQVATEFLNPMRAVWAGFRVR